MNAMTVMQSTARDSERAQLLNKLYDFNAERLQLAKDRFQDTATFFAVVNKLKEERRIAIELIALAHSKPIPVELLKELLVNHEIVEVGDRYVYNGTDILYREALCLVLGLAIRHFYTNLSDERFIDQIRMYLGHSTITRLSIMMYDDRKVA